MMLGACPSCKTSSPSTYIIYLHGAVVTEFGDNAINQAIPEWGPYEYSNIIDSLEKRRFIVISEIREKKKSHSYYVNKVSHQIDSLINLGVNSERIIILGASLGWDIGLRVSAFKQNKNLRFVLMGGCWPDSHKEYISLNLYGHFLSIIEESDPHGTCTQIFDNRNVTSFHEVTLKTGFSHGFIYKGRREWIDPIVDWVKTNLDDPTTH